MAVPRLQVLGGFQLFADGEARAAQIAKKAQALLAGPLGRAGRPESWGSLKLR